MYTPDTAAIVQHRLGARNVPAFDMAGSGCAGFLLALDVARSRARDGERRVLVIAVELLSRLMSWEDRETCVLFGDAAGAMVIGPGPGRLPILSATAGTDGSQAEILCLEAGGTRLPFDLEMAEKGLHKTSHHERPRGLSPGGPAHGRGGRDSGGEGRLSAGPGRARGAPPSESPDPRCRGQAPRLAAREGIQQHPRLRQHGLCVGAVGPRASTRGGPDRGWRPGAAHVVRAGFHWAGLLLRW